MYLQCIYQLKSTTFTSVSTLERYISNENMLLFCVYIKVKCSDITGIAEYNTIDSPQENLLIQRLRAAYL